jgi:hypothetical protein
MNLAAVEGGVKVIREIDVIEEEIKKIKEVRDGALLEFKESIDAISVTNLIATTQVHIRQQIY